MYPQTSIVPKFNAFYSNNEGRVSSLGATISSDLVSLKMFSQENV